MNLRRLDEKVVVITGGMGSVGKVLSNRFAELGARVFIIVRKNIELANEFVNSLPNQHVGHQAFLASVTDTDSLKQVVNTVAEQSGKCDILINAAAITKTVDNKKLESFTDEFIDEILINNVRGTFATIREFFPLLKISEDALIVNITSASALRGSNSNMMYGASKSSLVLLTQSLSKSLPSNIRVVSVCPGILEHATSGAWKPNGWNEKMAQEIPLGRVGTSEDVADAIEALATTMKYVSGSNIILDGGRLA
jgi:NAD(P)-dependent dehydrogenase (short-subunit alcohol dehydrogenase family)